MRTRRLRFVLLAASLILAVLLGTAYVQRAQLRTFYDGLLGRDFVGNGTGSVSVVIKPGETGVDVAANLESLGVVKNSDILYRLIVAENTVFYPGTYLLHKAMSSSAALAMLSNVTSHVVNRVTIKEGLRIGTTLKQLSDATGIPLGKLESEAANLKALGIPASAPNADGYLFPATYEFDPGTSAHELLQTMVDRTYEELDSFGVAEKDRHKVLTFASIIQKEARLTPDFYKVSRVFRNRLNIDMKLYCAEPNLN